MIPQRVYLRGFLSYRDEQEVCFDGSSLWMLSGLNGTGKSSIFDAVTYALFGHHRGGRIDAHELINKDSNGAVVEFDFTQDGESYRAHRTLKRKAHGGAAVTQQVMQRVGGKWAAVEDTSRKTEFDKWVREHVGLNFETFTSSVLLLQGRAEKLLDSTAKGRFEVLAGIVDLERYQKLHEKADGQRKTLKGRAEVVKNHLATLPEVSELELADAEGRIADVEEQRKQAGAEVERWQALEFQAKHWGELQTKLGGLRQKWEQARALVAEAGAIEKDMARLRELREALPHVETVFKQQRQAQELQDKLTDLAKKRNDLNEKIDDRKHAADLARDKRDALRKNVAKDEARLQEVTAELRRLEGVVARVNDYEKQRDTLAGFEAELARRPADTLQAQERAQARFDELTALAQVAPLLERLYEQREGLRLALTAEATQAKEEQSVKACGEKLKLAHDDLTKKVKAATAAREKIDRDLSAAQALFNQLEEGYKLFTELEGARVCRQCGQPLTPGHFEEEKAKRENEIADARSHNEKASAAQRSALKEEKRLLDKLKGLEGDLETAREKYRDARDGAKKARKEAEDCRAQCARAYRDLQEPFRSRVAPSSPEDWLTTEYPTAADVGAARKEATGCEAARRLLGEAQKQHEKWREGQTKVVTTREAVARILVELPPDLPALREKHVGLQADERAITDRVKGARNTDKVLEKEIERVEKDREKLQDQRAAIEATIKGEEATRSGCAKAVAAALKALTPDWQKVAEKAGLTEVHTLSGEKEQLEARGTEKRFKELEGARHGVDSLRDQIAGLEAEGEQVPPEARRDVSAVQCLLREAKQLYEERDKAHRTAERERDSLAQQKKQREKLQDDFLAVEKEHKVLTQLAELLGRDRLQLYLVRLAERQIVDHANAVLDRLSGGQLFLRLRGGEGEDGSDHALELEASNCTTGGQPINVAFLSGSQRFRVAVSLALGIGQYASRQHRPIESVIIDEGFGCLDRNGRQVMIQELQNLRGQLHCILLVSHQEEFADAFNDGYHFQLNDGSTKVTRVQR